MATHSSVAAWEITWTEAPGGLQSMRLQRVGHDLATKRQQQSFLVCDMLLWQPKGTNRWLNPENREWTFTFPVLCCAVPSIRRILSSQDEEGGETISVRAWGPTSVAISLLGLPTRPWDHELRHVLPTWVSSQYHCGPPPSAPNWALLGKHLTALCLLAGMGWGAAWSNAGGWPLGGCKFMRRVHPRLWSPRSSLACSSLLSIPPKGILPGGQRQRQGHKGAPGLSSASQGDKWTTSQLSRNTSHPGP